MNEQSLLKNNKTSVINPAQVNFTSLKEKLPVWIEETLKEIKND